MHWFFVTLLLIASTEAPSAGKNRGRAKTAPPAAVRPAEDPVEKEYQRLLEADDAAQSEVDQWIRDAQAFKEKGAGLPETTLAGRIEQRFEPVHKAYENFLQRHPTHVPARLAYGSFLSDLGKEVEGAEQWEKARQAEPRNPATWNNLANYYGHRGPIKKAFEYYARAIELNPDEPVYYQNLATTVFLFRKDAKEHYRITEQEVFDRALEHYRKAQNLDPHNFLLAQDIAQTYYGVFPPRPEEALAAWELALKMAADDVQREGVYLHLARVKISLAKFDEARMHLNRVTNASFASLKQRLVRNLAEKEKKLGPPFSLPPTIREAPVPASESTPLKP